MARPAAQLDLFGSPAPLATPAGPATAAAVIEWTRGPVDRTGIARFIHLMRHPDDPESSPRPPGGVADKAPHLALDKTTPGHWTRLLRRQLADGAPRTFNRLAIELLDLTADVVFDTPFDEAIWLLVEHGEVEHTLDAPVFFRRRPSRVEMCKPCRDGDHYDHHRGVWAHADGSDPVVCLCERHDQ